MASATNEGPSANSFLAYSAEWLASFGARVPDAALLEAGQGFYDALITHCLSVTHADPDRIVCSMRVPANLCNTLDRLHGGAIASLVDVVGSAAIFAMGASYSGVSADINVTYMAGAPLGEEIEIEAKPLKVGKNLAFVAVDVRLKATGKLVAQGRHTKFVGSSGGKHLAIYSKL